METGQKYTTQFTRSFFIPKKMLKGLRIFVLIYVVILLLLDYIKHFDRGSAFTRDFTSVIVFTYFNVIVVISYKLSSSPSFELSNTDTNLTRAARALFAIAFTSTLFDTVIFWAILYPHVYPHTHVTYFTIHFYVINLLIMIAEAIWSHMLIPATQFFSIAIMSLVYVGIYFLWKVINKGWMVNPETFPHINGVPLEVELAVGILVTYMLAFWVVYGFVKLRDRLYYRGLYTKEETYHILDSQSFR